MHGGVSLLRERKCAMPAAAARPWHGVAAIACSGEVGTGSPIRTRA